MRPPKSKATTKIIVVPLLEKSYLSVIKNSVGSNQFRNFHATVNGQEQDILRNGELSCAFFVSSILKTFSLISETHATVQGLVKDLEKNGWVKTTEANPGDVLVWNEITYPNGETHAHIGFYFGNDQAISTSSSHGIPTVHHLTFNNTREITFIYKCPPQSFKKINAK